MSPMSLSFTRTGNSQCGNVNIVVNNGTSPFQVEIIPEYGFVLDLPASIPYFLVVTDADGSSAVEGLLAAGGASDNSCLNAATTMTVGMFSSMFSGSGVVMPSSTLTSASGTSDAGTSTSVTMTAEATQQGFGHTSATSKLSIGEIVGVTVTGIVAFTALLAFVWWLLRRRKTGMSSPDEGVKPPEMNLTSSGYNLAYTSQSTYNGPPQIQERTGFTGEPYTPPGAIMTAQSYDFNVGMPPVQHGGITTHAPQARHLVQSASHYNVSSLDQQPLASGNPPQTTATSTPVAGIRNSFESAPSPPWGVDRKQQVVSPVLASPSGSHTFPWGVATSPPPRSHTGTALPPYELTPQSQEYRRG
ncbi:hypothetical protein FRC09_019743 [Ceratobasidium sp. 395]|nr:hypothetical protein FRC09_019743 [Ceratobasidium sp. 395]